MAQAIGITAWAITKQPDFWEGKYADFGATGHVDLLRVEPGGASCQGTCYWWDKKGPMTAYLWATTPRSS
jgi:hypothetical protein